MVILRGRWLNVRAGELSTSAAGAPMAELTGLDWRSAGRLVLTGRRADMDIDARAVMRRGRCLAG